MSLNDTTSTHMHNWVEIHWAINTMILPHAIKVMQKIELQPKPKLNLIKLMR